MQRADQLLDASASELNTMLGGFYDELSEFNEDCAFLCEAFSAIAINNSTLDLASVGGLERSAYRLKQQAAVLQERLREIKELSSDGLGASICRH